MSDERKDADAAAQEFMALFAAEDEKNKARIIRSFLKGFLKRYKELRNKILAWKEDGEPTESPTNLATNHSQIAYKLIASVISGKERLKESEKAELLGQSLGLLLAAVEYGIPHPQFATGGSAPGNMINWFDQIAVQLQTLGKKVRISFLKNRISRIAREHGRDLTPEKKKLIAEIAACFAKV